MVNSLTLFFLLPLPLKIAIVVVGGLFLTGKQVQPQAAPAEIRVEVAEVQRQEVKQPKAGEILINVRADGTLEVGKNVLTKTELRKKLTKIGKVKIDQSVRIRGNAKVPYKRIVEVVDLCQKAGVSNISFATQVKRNKNLNPNKP